MAVIITNLEASLDAIEARLFEEGQKPELLAVRSSLNAALIAALDVR